MKKIQVRNSNRIHKNKLTTNIMHHRKTNDKNKLISQRYFFNFSAQINYEYHYQVECKFIGFTNRQN